MTLKCLCLRRGYHSNKNLSDYRLAQMHVNKNYVDYSDSENGGQSWSKNPNAFRVIGSNVAASSMSFDEGKSKKKMKFSHLDIGNLKVVQRGRSIKRRIKQSYSIDSLTSLEKINTTSAKVNYDYKASNNSSSTTNLNSRKSLASASGQLAAAKKSSSNGLKLEQDSQPAISKHPNLAGTKQTGSVNKAFVSELDQPTANRPKQVLDNDAFKKILVNIKPVGNFFNFQDSKTFGRKQFDFNLPNDKIESLMKLPRESKMKMYNSYLHQAEQVGFKEESIDAFVQSLRTLVTTLSLSNHSEREIDCFVAEETKQSHQSTYSLSDTCSSHLKRIENLKLVLKSSPLRWVLLQTSLSHLQVPQLAMTLTSNS